MGTWGALEVCIRDIQALVLGLTVVAAAHHSLLFWRFLSVLLEGFPDLAWDLFPPLKVGWQSGNCGRIGPAYIPGPGIIRRVIYLLYVPRYWSVSRPASSKHSGLVIIHHVSGYMIVPTLAEHLYNILFNMNLYSSFWSSPVTDSALPFSISTIVDVLSYPPLGPVGHVYQSICHSRFLVG